MTEIIFLIEESPEGGFIATALGESIFTDGENYEEIKRNIKDAVDCHFDEKRKPKLIRLHIVKDEVILA
ncbi:MAG TPA: hypothetical protein VIJ57_12025 [Hanamia sp.]